MRRRAGVPDLRLCAWPCGCSGVGAGAALARVPVVDEPGDPFGQTLLDLCRPLGGDPAVGDGLFDALVGGVDESVDHGLRVYAVRGRDLGDRLAGSELVPQLLAVDADRPGDDAARPTEHATD